jgi:hypothetical protein
MDATNRFSEIRPFNMYKVEQKLRAVPQIWKSLLLYAEVGDIVEVYWEKEDSHAVQVSISPSSNYRLFQMGPPATIHPKLFSTILTSPKSVPYHNDTIVFISPLMTTLDFELFTDRMGDTDRDRIKRIALKSQLFAWSLPTQGVDPLDLQVLARYTNLRELIITSEITSEEERPPLGPLASPPENIDFDFATSTETRDKVLYDANDCRRQTEIILGDLRDMYDYWPGGPVKVDVVSVLRDGQQKTTEFKTDKQMELEEKKKKKEEDEIARQIEESNRRLEGFKVEQEMMGDSDGEDSEENTMAEESNETEGNDSSASGTDLDFGFDDGCGIGLAGLRL